MTKTEFVEATSRIEKYHGKQFEIEQLRIMFEELENIDIERYKQIIAKLIRTNKFMPKISDILDLNDSLPKIKNSENKSYEKCEKCNGTGYILYHKLIPNGSKKSDYIYATACSCGRKEKYTGKEYYMIDEQELNLA